MTTPIYDFLTAYRDRGGVRLHMPGHKGKGPLGIEALDITEVKGADVLGEATGIIGESEANAASLFGSGKTLYTTGGSTAAILGMLSLAVTHLRTKERPTLLAARNAHRAFLEGAALLDIPVTFMLPENAKTVYSGVMTPEEVEKAILSAEAKPFALYITSPTYLGEMWDIAAVADVCRKHDIPLLVDNAHGAYLAFLSPSQHPIRMGAAMCTDSAHKTLPVLTGGAYLHIAKEYSYLYSDAKEALSLVTTTSPSYLVLASLDLANRTLADGYRERLCEICARVALCKKRIEEMGFCVLSSEPLKIVLAAGNTETLANALRTSDIEPEMCDDLHLVFMASADNEVSDFDKLERVLSRSAPIAPAFEKAPTPRLGKAVTSLRTALFSQRERIATRDAVGRVYAEIAASCPPAVSIVIAGEEIDVAAVEALLYYGVEQVRVLTDHP